MVTLKRLLATPEGVVGLAVLVVVLAIALLGPFVADYPIDAVVGPPGMPPEGDTPLGTDFLGRDVLSRVLHGGTFVIGAGLLVTAIAYLIGLTMGLTAGFSRSFLDPLIMRGVDVILSFPAMLILLLLVAGLGTSVPVLIAGVVLVMLPGISRVVRAATLEVSTRGFVEAAIARGESSPSIVVRDIVPNLAPVLLADFGVRFSYSIILIASMNYLGLGLTPPAADWGLLIAENRQLISLNPWPVVVPALLLATLMIGVNLVADAYGKTLGRSGATGRKRSRNSRLRTSVAQQSAAGE